MTGSDLFAGIVVLLAFFALVFFNIILPRKFDQKSADPVPPEPPTELPKSDTKKKRK